MVEALERAWSIPELKRRISFVLSMLMIFAVGAHIPVPGINSHIIDQYLKGKGGGGLLGLIDMFSGGSFRRMSMFALGIQLPLNVIYYNADDDRDCNSASGCSTCKKRVSRGRKQIQLRLRAISRLFLPWFRSFGITIALNHSQGTCIYRCCSRLRSPLH